MMEEEQIAEISESPKRRTIKLQSAKRAFRQLPYIYFIGLLTLVYIFNVHKAEKNDRYIEALKQNVKEKEWEYNSGMSDVIYEGIPSKTEERVKAYGLEPVRKAPKVIVVGPDKQ